MTTVIVVGCLWFLLSLGASFHGAYVGFQAPAISKPIKVNTVRRKQPSLPWYLSFKIIYPVFGLIVFASVFLEFYYILDSTWRSYHIYMLFSFLMTSMVILFSVVAMLSIVQTYLLLKHLTYEWWWRSFLGGFASSTFMFAYSIYYMIFVLEMDWLVADFVYMLYMMLFTVSFGIMCGFVSTAASFAFVKVIYSNIKGE